MVAPARGVELPPPDCSGARRPYAVLARLKGVSAQAPIVEAFAHSASAKWCPGNPGPGCHSSDHGAGGQGRVTIHAVAQRIRPILGSHTVGLMVTRLAESRLL